MLDLFLSAQRNSEKMSVNCNQHKIGEYVFYRQNGICVISDISTENLGVMGVQTYYVLTSVGNENNKFFVPVNSPLTEEMYRLLTAEEIDSIILRTSENDDSKWIDDDKSRSALFDSVLKSGNRTDILRMVKSISVRKLSLEQAKKKLHAADERILGAAEKLIKEEFAFVLKIDEDSVIPYILDKVNRI